MLGGNITPLIILIVVLVMVIIYAITVTPAEREKLLGTISYERDLVNTVPGDITPIPKTTYKLSHDLSAAEPNFSPLPISQVMSGQITLKRSIINNQGAKFSIDVNKTDLSSAKLEFEVTAVEGGKELIVELNDNAVFSGVLAKGDVTVPLPIAQIIDGTNSVRITIAPSFGTVAYALKNVNFVEQKFQPEKASATQTFTLMQQELNGIISARLTGLAKQTAQPATLSLSLNNKSIYSASLSADTTIDLELPISLLNNSNTLNWTVSKGGAYQITLGRVETKYAKTPLNTKSYSFFVTDIEHQGIKSGLLVCTLSMTASEPITQTVTVQVNAYKLNLKMTDGQLSYDVCNYLKSGDNFLYAQSPNSIYLSQLRLLLSGKAYGV